MRWYLILAFALTCFGCATNHDFARKCTTLNSGLSGCSAPATFVSKSTTVTHRYNKVAQAPTDNPVHLAEALDHLDSYCPMDFKLELEDLGPEWKKATLYYFDDGVVKTRYLKDLEAAHVLMGYQSAHYLSVRMDFNNFKKELRRMRYNCWAVSVQQGHKGFYVPLHILKPDSSLNLDDQSAAILNLEPAY